MTTKAKHISQRPHKTFELKVKAGALPSLKPAAEPAPSIAEPEAKVKQAECAAQKEIVLRVVEAVKAL